MIARLWKGRKSQTDAHNNERFLREAVLPDLSRIDCHLGEQARQLVKAKESVNDLELDPSRGKLRTIPTKPRQHRHDRQWLMSDGSAISRLRSTRVRSFNPPVDCLASRYGRREVVVHHLFKRLQVGRQQRLPVGDGRLACAPAAPESRNNRHAAVVGLGVDATLGRPASPE